MRQRKVFRVSHRPVGVHRCAPSWARRGGRPPTPRRCRHPPDTAGGSRHCADGPTARAAIAGGTRSTAAPARRPRGRRRARSSPPQGNTSSGRKRRPSRPRRCDDMELPARPAGRRTRRARRDRSARHSGQRRWSNRHERLSPRKTRGHRTLTTPSPQGPSGQEHASIIQSAHRSGYRQHVPVGNATQGPREDRGRRERHRRWCPHRCVNRRDRHVIEPRSESPTVVGVDGRCMSGGGHMRDALEGAPGGARRTGTGTFPPGPAMPWSGRSGAASGVSGAIRAPEEDLHHGAGQAGVSPRWSDASAAEAALDVSARGRRPAATLGAPVAVFGQEAWLARPCVTGADVTGRCAVVACGRPTGLRRSLRSVRPSLRRREPAGWRDGVAVGAGHHPHRRPSSPAGAAPMQPSVPIRASCGGGCASRGVGLPCAQCRGRLGHAAVRRGAGRARKRA